MKRPILGSECRSFLCGKSESIIMLCIFCCVINMKKSTTLKTPTGKESSANTCPLYVDEQSAVG